jgi:hypothetical protein
MLGCDDAKEYEEVCKFFGKTLTSRQVALISANQFILNEKVVNLWKEEFGTFGDIHEFLKPRIISDSLVVHLLANELNCLNVFDKSMFEMYQTLMCINADELEYIWEKWEMTDWGVHESPQICLEICIFRYVAKLFGYDPSYFLESMIKSVQSRDVGSQLSSNGSKILNDILRHSIWEQDRLEPGGCMRKLLIDKWMDADFFTGKLIKDYDVKDERILINLIEVGGQKVLKKIIGHVELKQESIDSALKVYNKTTEDIMAATNLFRDLCLIISSY